MNNIIVGLIVLGVIGVGVFFLTQNKGENQNAGQVQSTVTPIETVTEVKTGVPSRIIEVKGSEYSFSPKAIDLAAGETIAIKFTNTGNLPHDFNVDGLAIKTKVLKAGESETINITADKTGSYTFYCSVGNHKQLGMEGKVEVK